MYMKEKCSSAAQDENPDVLPKALGDVAKDSGLGRENIYNALSPGAKPRYETVAAVMRALKVKMVVRGR
jgi:probable addiction module antidote protein